MMQYIFVLHSQVGKIIKIKHHMKCLQKKTKASVEEAIKLSRYSDEGTTPLMEVVRWVREPNIIAQLLERYSEVSGQSMPLGTMESINTRDNNGVTALIHATRYSAKNEQVHEYVKMLLLCLLLLAIFLHRYLIEAPIDTKGVPTCTKGGSPQRLGKEKEKARVIDI